MELSFVVSVQENGMLLRDFLRRKRVSAGLCTAVKAAGGFFCNGMPIHTNVRVCAGSCVTFVLPPEQETSVAPQQLPLCIAYEDAHTMVLEKPAGQTVHPTRGYKDGTLGNAFCGLMQQRGQQAVFRPVNRIDRNTSGLVLCALNAYAAPLLAADAAKVYYAVVQGRLPLGEGVVEAPIALCEDSLIRRRVADAGKPSRSDYTVLAANDAFSLVRVVPVTGRTHQIRVHFAWLGHPLAGDDLYGGQTTSLARHALHCGEISFCQIASGHRCVVRSPLPPDMAQLVRHGMSESAAALW